MPTLAEALMQGGAAFMRGEAEVRDVREQRRQQNLLQALQMQDMLERRRLAERGQTFEEQATRARLGLQQQSQQATERRWAEGHGLDVRRFETGRADVAAATAAVQQATAFNVQSRLGPEVLATGEVQAAPLTIPQPLAGPVMELPGGPGPRMTQPRLLSAQGEPLAQERGQPLRGPTLPVPRVTEEMLAAPLTPISQAPLAPQALPTATRPWAEAPYGETLAAAAGIPGVQFGQQAGVTTAQVPTTEEAEEAAWVREQHEYQRIENEFWLTVEMPERMAEIDENQARRAVQQVLRETGHDPAVLSAMILANQAQMSDLELRIAEETAPDAIKLLREQRRAAELDSEIAETALAQARFEVRYLQEHGYLPPQVSEHTAYADYGPEQAGVEVYEAMIADGRLELDWARHGLDVAEFEGERAGVPGARPTEDQEKAVTPAMKLIQTLYDDLMAGEKADARLLLPQLKVYMQQAGPLSVEIQRALHAVYTSAWEQEHVPGTPSEDPAAFEDFPWDELYTITGQYGARRAWPRGATPPPEGVAGGEAAPFGERSERPVTAPP